MKFEKCRRCFKNDLAKKEALENSTHLNSFKVSKKRTKIYIPFHSQKLLLFLIDFHLLLSRPSKIADISISQPEILYETAESNFFWCYCCWGSLKKRQATFGSRQQVQEFLDAGEYFWHGNRKSRGLLYKTGEWMRWGRKNSNRLIVVRQTLASGSACFLFSH